MNRQRLQLPARDGLESWSPDIGEPTGNQRGTDIAAQLPKMNVVGSNPIGHSTTPRVPILGLPIVSKAPTTFIGGWVSPQRSAGETARGS